VPQPEDRAGIAGVLTAHPQSRKSLRIRAMCLGVVNALCVSHAALINSRPDAAPHLCYAALTPATKVLTSLESCSACFDTSDAAVST
jgi:hypothetical protein